MSDGHRTPGYDYTCAACGRPTSMGWSATARYIVRPACRDCYVTNTENFDHLVHVPFDQATNDELLAAREGMKNIQRFDGALLEEEIRKRLRTATETEGR